MILVNHMESDYAWPGLSEIHSRQVSLQKKFTEIWEHVDAVFIADIPLDELDACGDVRVSFACDQSLQGFRFLIPFLFQQKISDVSVLNTVSAHVELI